MDVNPGDDVKSSSVLEESTTSVDPMELSSPAVCGVKSTERGDAGPRERSVSPVEDFPKTSSGTEFPEHDLQACTETELKDSEVEVQRRRYERNLEIFKQYSASLNKVGSKEKTVMTRKDIKSDDAISKVEYFGDESRVSSIPFEIKRKSSSAPPSFNTEIVSRLNSGDEVLLNLLNRKNTETSEHMPESSKTMSTSVHSKPVSVETENKSLPGKASDYNSSESYDIFKVPDIPKKSKVNAITTGGKSASLKKSDSMTSVLERPTDFNVKPRKAFYTFVPGRSTDVLKCQSLPNINKEQRRETKQRRSVNLEPHLSAIRPFSDEATSEASEIKESKLVDGTAIATSTVASKICSQEKFSDTKSSDNISDTLSARKSELHIDLPAYKRTTRVQSTETTEAFVKRKDMSPLVVESSATSTKKIRSSSVKTEKDESDKEIQDINFPSEDYQTPSCTSREKFEPKERKSSDTSDDDSEIFIQ